MASKYYLTLTTYGSDLIAQAHETTPLYLKNLVIGDANGVPYDPLTAIDRTHLINQKASVSIQHLEVIENIVRVTATVGADIGGFNIHEIGLIDESGKLVYIGNYHGGYKSIFEDGVGGELTISINIKGVAANNISLSVDPNINTATQAWIEDNYIPRNELVDNLTTDDAKKPVSAKQAKALQDNKLDKTANAVSATKLKNARKINTIDFDGSQDINIEAPLRWVGQISTPDQLNSAVLDGKYTVLDLDVAGLYGYGVLVVLRNGGLCHQIYYPHLGSSLNNATMAMRQTWNMNGDIASWSEWRVVGTRDDSKLPLAGGTLTGHITIDTAEAQIRHKPSNSYLFINSTGWGVYSPQGHIPLSTLGGGTGNLEGRAPSADRLATPRNIFGQTFDGSSDIGGTVTASTGLVQTDSFHYIDMGRSGLDRMNFYNYGAIFNFIDSQNGNVVARITQNGIDCNAASASKLKTPRKINGVDFDASTDINLPLIGIGQTWQDVSALRLDGVTYTNTSPRTITVFFGGGRQGVPATEFHVGDEIFSLFGGGAEPDEVYFSLPIPPGATYGYKNKPQYSYVFRELK